MAAEPLFCDILQSEDALCGLLGLAANQQQHLLPTTAQLAHSASRKSVCSG